MLQAALEYARKGYKVVHIRPNKKPYGGTSAYKDGTTDEAQIRHWWTIHPEALIGLPMSPNGLLGLDLDRHKGKPDGVAAWKGVCKERNAPPNTATMAKTAGENPGMHLIYQHPGEDYVLRVPSKCGVDLRDKAYIAVAPSVFAETGKAYEWFPGRSILEADPAPLPNQILQWLTTKDHEGLGGSVTDACVVLLVAHGWTVAWLSEDNVYLLRPGKTEGHSASWNGKTFWVYSTDETIEPFEPETAYSYAHVQRLLEGPETAWFKAQLNNLYKQILAASADIPTKDRLLAELARLLAQASPIVQSRYIDKIGGINACPKTTFKTQIKFAEQTAKKAAKEAATGDKIKGVTTENYKELFETFGFKLRLNECNDDVELNGTYCGDLALAKIDSTLADWAIEHPDRRINYRHMESAMTVVAERNAYHPIKQYLEAVEWDGSDHIDELSSYFEGEYFDIWFRHWIVGAVAKIYEQFQNPMLVLSGKTNVGKSTFARWLCPEALQVMAAEAPLNPDNKDCRMRLWTTWIWEVAELGATTKKTVQEALKWILTAGTVRERKSYGHRDTIKPVISSFIGTVNPDAGFLTDRTGNRRYLVTEVTDIDWDYSKDIDVDQVWAQAKALFDEGDDWQLSDDEKDLQNSENEKYMNVSVVSELLAKLFQFDGNLGHGVWAATVIETLAQEGYKAAHQNFTLREVVSIFRKWGSVGQDKTVKGRRGTIFPGIVSIRTFKIGDVDEEANARATS